jgi:signal peptidase
MVKVFFNTIYYLTIGAVGLLGLLLVGTLMPIPGNFEVKIVKSGSMEPTLPVGSIVVIRPAASYSVGDVITFGADTKTQIPTTHRIVGAQGEGANRTFTTRGDANDAPDQTTVRASDIHGKLVFDLPYVGFVLAFARTKLGFLLLVGVPALFVFFEEGKNIFLELKKMRARRRRREMPQQARAQEIPRKESSSAPSASSIDGVVRRMAMPPMPIKERGGGSYVGRVIAVVLGVGLMAGVTGAMGTYGDTVAYYADRAVSVANSLGASGDFSAARFVLSFSAPELVSISSSTSPGEEPPPADVLPQVEASSTPATEAVEQSVPPPQEEASSTPPGVTAEAVVPPPPAEEPAPGGAPETGVLPEETPE